MGDAAVNLVRSILNYIQQRAKSMSGPALDQLTSAQCQACITHLRSANLSHEDATNIVSLLHSDSCLFNDDHIAQISGVLDVKLSSSTSSTGHASSSKPHQQTHQYIRHYFTEYMWQVIYSHASMTSKLEQCATFFVQTLGLRNPCEKTRRDLIAIILAATDQDCVGEDSLQHVHTLKRLMANARAIFSTCERGPDSYPPTVAAYMHMYPTAYAANEPPVECKVPEAAFINKQSATLCRSTHSSLQAAGGGSHSARRFVGKRSIAKQEPEPDMRDQLLNYVLSGTSHTGTGDLSRMQAFVQQQSSLGVGELTHELKREMKSEPDTAEHADPSLPPTGLMC